MKQDPSGIWTSDDGYWRWNGHSWVVFGDYPRWPAVPLAFGDAITLPTRDRNWIETIALEGLIGLIPIVGWVQLIGWMMSYLDQLRVGQPVLPAAGFKYAKRGWRVALVGLIYLISLAVIFYAGFFLIVFGLMSGLPSAPSAGASDASFPPFAFAGLFAFQGFFLLLYALLHLLIVPVILRTDRIGVAAGLNPVGAIRMALADIKISGATGVLAFIAYFIGSLGIYVLFVGYVFTSAYGWAMLASTVRWYEERLAPGSFPGGAPSLPGAPPPPEHRHS